ncbi:MAG: glycosyltransferase family 9 protein [Ignavibacteria bacterium]
MPAIKKILVIRLSSFGDIVLSFPLIKKLKEKFPGAEIDFLTKKEYEEVISLNPDVSSKIFWNDSSGMRKQIRKEKYDLIIDIHKNFRSFYVSFLNSGKVRRYKKENVKKFFLVKLKLSLFKEIIPVYKKYLYTLKDYLSGSDHEFTLSDLNFDRGRFTDETYIVISPASRHFTKTYPKEKFVEFINKLNGKVVLVGSDTENDKVICDYIQKNCHNIINLCGKLNIKELANILYNSEYVMCNDSAVLHLSEAVGKKVVAIFGSTVREFGFFPQLKNSKVFEIKALQCRPCTHIGRNECPLGHFRCMREIQLTVNS